MTTWLLSAFGCGCCDSALSPHTLPMGTIGCAGSGAKLCHFSALRFACCFRIVALLCFYCNRTVSSLQEVCGLQNRRRFICCRLILIWLPFINMHSICAISHSILALPLESVSRFSAFLRIYIGGTLFGDSHPNFSHLVLFLDHLG